MYTPIVKRLLQNRGSGSSCILTQTNEEAVIMVALLRKYGIHGKLIQSMDGFAFWNLAEMRNFLKYIGRERKSPLISPQLWEEAKTATYSAFAKSSSLSYIKRCIETFEQVNKAKYYSDFYEYIYESSIEDFCEFSDTDVVVSTIHKAKGREFDDVYILLSGDYIKDSTLMRRYYVGMTRAKNRLYIHTNDISFARTRADRVVMDPTDYQMPEQVVLQLTHKDVHLGFFKNKKKEILALRGGDTLRYDNDILYTMDTNLPVAKLSKNMHQVVAEWEQKGYSVKSASVRFIVAWKPKDAPKEDSESAVVLADLLLAL